MATATDTNTADTIKKAKKAAKKTVVANEMESMGPLAIAGVQPYQVKPGEEYMNDAQKEHFRKILTAWRDQLRSEVDRTVGHMKNEAANFPDPVDRASQEEEFSLELRARDRERKLIKKIEKTLVKLNND